jgi:hypothetical protein
MGTTNSYDWPYPEATDAPDGAGQMKALAMGVDSTLHSMETSKIPATPIDWTNFTVSGTGVSSVTASRVRRDATGRVEVQIRCGITQSTTGVRLGTLPTWAWPTIAQFGLPVAGNTFNGAEYRADISSSDGGITLQFAPTGSNQTFICMCLIYTP